MKHIFKKLHKSYDTTNTTNPNRISPNETLISPSTQSSAQSSSNQSNPQSTTSTSQSFADQSNPTPPPPANPPPQPAAPAITTATEDYFLTEEEFQVQLALAISASSNTESDREEDDQIRAATLLSLGGEKGRRKGDEVGGVGVGVVSGEALSRRYWEYNVLDYTERVVDGFYDVFGLETDSAIQGKMPSLAKLETSTGDSGFEAVIVNRTIDPVLQELEQVAQCIALDCGVAEVDVLVQRLAELVTDHLGGPVRDAHVMLSRWTERSAELRTSLHTCVFPVGSLKIGLSRHRALLFKVLAEIVGIQCRLVKGSHYTGVEEDAVIIIKLNERESLVDLMAAPGTLIPVEPSSFKEPYANSFDQNVIKLPSTKSTNDSEVALSWTSSDSTVEGGLHFGSETTQFGPSMPVITIDSGAGPSRVFNMSTFNPLDVPSTSAVGASLYKGNRGGLAVGDGFRMNLNVVPQSQNNPDDPKNLFADLNPFLIPGAGRTSVRNKPKENKADEAEWCRNEVTSRRPPLPVTRKNNVLNELPGKKEQDFFDGLFPLNNVVDNDYQTSSSSSMPENAYPNISKPLGVLSVAGRDKTAGNVLGSSPSTARGSSQVDKITSNHIGTHTEVKPGQMDVSLSSPSLLDDSRNPTSSSYASANKAEPVIDDVGECEIPWEDLVIGERIGLGSYGEVYRADWNGTEVAVKKFLDQDFSGAALVEFRSEVRIMRRLRHPNIVLFVGAVTRPPNLSIVSEYLPRGSLYRIIHRPYCDIDEKCRIKMALDVARGMNCLHTSTPTIVHRDLKSPNLLVDDNWNVKVWCMHVAFAFVNSPTNEMLAMQVCDFGLSRLKHNTFLSSKSTAGTPEWMAPEVLRNEPSNEKCDVYSFGVILWELATLRLPWSEMNPMQVVGAVGFQNRRLEIPKEVDPLVARLISECWQMEPNKRPSFAELCAALKSLQQLVVPSSIIDQQSSHIPQEISVNSTP
ncbi:Serine/threonine-protein kinase EDR1-like protein [Drosera capensis]